MPQCNKSFSFLTKDDNLALINKEQRGREQLQSCSRSCHAEHGLPNVFFAVTKSR